MQGIRDEELMGQYQKGDAAAMDALVARYKDPVFRFLFRLSRSADDAEELAQEVFVRVHEHRMDYRPVGKFSTWIFSIAHNLFVSNIRKRWWLTLWPRTKEDPDELVEFESPQPTPDQAACQGDARETVRRCLNTLPFLQKEVLVLREYESLDYEEIARVLRRPVGTIKTLLHRARENLKIKLLPYHKESEGRM